MPVDHENEPLARKVEIRLARESAQTDFKQGFSIGVETG